MFCGIIEQVMEDVRSSDNKTPADVDADFTPGVVWSIAGRLFRVAEIGSVLGEYRIERVVLQRVRDESCVASLYAEAGGAKGV